VDLLPRLVGMYAFAIFDAVKSRVFLARDPAGIKPLYYVHNEKFFAFASETKTLLEIPEVSREADPQNVYNYLRYNLSDSGADTFFSDILQLPAAHYLDVGLETVKPEPVCFWKLSLDHRSDLSFTEATENLRHLLLESVKFHLRSDVPVGAALSGGI